MIGSKWLSQLVLLGALLITMPLNAMHAQGQLKSSMVHFDSLSIANKIKLTEESLYSDPSLTPEFAARLSPLIQSSAIDIQHRFLLIKAHISLTAGNTDAAREYLQLLQGQNPSVNVLAKMLYMQARLAQYLDDLVLAFDYLDSAQQIPKQQLSTINQMYLFLLAADLNLFTNRFDLASSYISQAMTVVKPLNNPDLDCFVFSNYPRRLSVSKQFHLLKKRVDEAINICQKSDNKFLLAEIYMDYASVFFATKDYSEHQRLVLIAIDLYNKFHYVYNVPAAKLELIFSYINANELVNAQVTLNQLLAMDWLNDQRKPLFLAQSLIFENSGHPNRALKFYKKYLAIELKYNDTQMQKKLAYTQTRFDSKINKKIALLTELDRESLALYFKIGGLEIFLLVVLSLFLLSIPTYFLVFYNPFSRQPVSVIEGSDFDDLTAVYHFEDGFKQAQNTKLTSDMYNKYYAVVTIDIDYMKAINNSFNYDFGDQFIRVFASEVKGIYSGKGLVTRVQRNDFVVFILVDDIAEINVLLINTHLTLKELEIDGHRPNATCSIGYSMKLINQQTNFPNICTSLVGQASIALRYSKSHGGKRSTLYHSDLLLDQSLSSAKITDEYLDIDELVPF